MFNTDLENLIAGYMAVLSSFALIGLGTVIYWIVRFFA